MDHRPVDYAGRVRDPAWERELVDWLRSQPEAARLRFIEEFLDIQVVVALQLANRCLTERPSFEALLERGLRAADAGSIKYWLESLVPRMGIRRVFRLLGRDLDSNPEGVAKALYWIPQFQDEAGFSWSDHDRLVERVEARAASRPGKVP